MQFYVKFGKTFALKVCQSLSGLAALFFERLGISGHYTFTFGKYFRNQRNHKTHTKFLRFAASHGSAASDKFGGIQKVEKKGVICFDHTKIIKKCQKAMSR